MEKDLNSVEIKKIFKIDAKIQFTKNNLKSYYTKKYDWRLFLWIMR